MLEFGATLLASPITWFVAAAVAIGLAAYFIYKHWDKISAWFKNLWAKVKVAFTQAWEWIKNMFLNYTPQGLIIKHWDKITAWFKGLWEKVKNVFMGWVDWVMGLGSKFLEAGKNMVRQIWEGIKALAHLPLQAMQQIYDKIQAKFPSFFPKSNATIQVQKSIAVQHALLKSMPGVANVATSLIPQMPQPIPVYSHNNSSVNFHTTIHLNGSATQKDADMINKNMKDQFAKLMRDHQAQQSRTGFNH